MLRILYSFFQKNQVLKFSQVGEIKKRGLKTEPREFATPFLLCYTIQTSLGGIATSSARCFCHPPTVARGERTGLGNQVNRRQNLWKVYA